MSEFRIEKGVPMPSAGSNKKKYFFDLMEVGDSVFLADTPRNAIAPNLRIHRPMRFAIRAQNGGLRVWRIE
jgi:hypothetical protein